MHQLERFKDLVTLAVLSVTLTVASSFISLSSARAQGRPSADAPGADLTPTLFSALSQAAAVVEGVVSDISFTYSDEEGPWTIVTLTKVTVHLGNAPSEVVIRLCGGPKPNGRRLTVSDQAKFVLGERYVVALRNTRWFLSPVLAGMAFRVGKLDGAEVLVDSAGGLVTSVGTNGVEVSPALFEAPTPDGKTIPPLRANAANIARAIPARITKAQLLESLRGAASARGLKIAGRFYDLPATESNWRSAPVAGAPPAGSAAASQNSDAPSVPDPLAP